MKISTLLVGLILSLPALAGTCQDTWKKENETNKVIESCELEWDDSGIELVRLTSGCSFPGPASEPCFILRSCGKEKQKGATVFRSSVPPESYCISGSDTEAMGATAPFAGKAFIICGGQKKPESIRLSGPDGKLTKTCKFPF